MKTLGISLVLIVWMIMTFILAISLVGIVVLVREDSNCEYWKGEIGESNWFKIGKSLTRKLIE